MSTLTQRSFSGGEISPSLYARVDFAKYQVGLRQCRNFIVQKHGGVANRPGTQFICEAKTPGKQIRLIPFIFNNEQTYILEFGENYIRFIKDGNTIKLAAQNIEDIIVGAMTTVQITAHGYMNGDELFVSGIVGPSDLNNRTFIVEVIDVDNFYLKNKDGSHFDSTGFPIYVSDGTTEKIYEISSPYLEADLKFLQFAQSADVVTIVNGNYKPAELKRFSDINWTLENINFKSDVPFPTDIVTPASSGTKVREYKVTSVRKEDYKESNAGLRSGPTVINAITNANPARVTLAAAGVIKEGDELYLEVVGMTEVHDRRFIATNVSGAEFDLQGEDSTNYGIFVSGNAFPCFVRFTQDNINATTPVNLTWSQLNDEDIQEYNIYRRDDESGAFGLVGVSRGKSFKDVGATPDTKITPPSERNPFVKQGDYPNAITYFQQRLFLANTANDPEKIYSSKIGDFKNFGISSPIQDDDAITFKIAGRQVNAVKHLLDLGQLVAFTQGNEAVVNGNDSSLLTPTSVNIKQQSYNGSSFLSPLVVNDTALYVQERGSIVRDIAFRFEADGYAGDDLTIFAFHLFQGFTLQDWTYQQIPHSVVWAVRDDGTLLGLTYLKEQRILAWHRHDFGSDLCENVCAVPEMDEDALYVVVNRNGLRYVERFATRQVFDVVDSKFMDSFLSFDGRNTGLTEMTLSGGMTWAYDENLTLTSSDPFFTANDIGNNIVFTDADGLPIRLKINTFNSDTEVIVKPHRTVPVELRGVAQINWSKAVDELSGLWHLEGRKVSVFGDGFVVASPNNAAYQEQTVVNGKITLEKPFSVIHVGLPYISDLETLNIDTPSGESIADKKMIVQSVNIFVEKSRGGFVGPNPPPDDLLQDLFEFKIRNDENYESPVELRTGTMESTIDSQYNDNGRVFIRQVDPLPMTILSIQPAGMYPFRG